MRIKIEKPNDIEHVEPYISFDISDDLCKLVMIHVFLQEGVHECQLVWFLLLLLNQDHDPTQPELVYANRIFYTHAMWVCEELAIVPPWQISKSKPVMDLSPVTDALAVKSFDKIADICDTLMLQVAAEGISFQDDWPYAIHLLGYFYLDDCDSARFLWKTIPTSVKESKPEVAAAWRIGQKLWTRDYAGVYEAIRGFDWIQDAKDMVAAFSDVYTKRMFQLLLSAYSTVTIRDLALFLGMTEDDATTYVAEKGWTVDAASQMVTVKKQAIKREQKVDSSKLQRLTEYVFHLEH
ncbi:unnamed protein product [Brassica oleracea]